MRDEQDDHFSRRELEWGKERARELAASGMNPFQAAREALRELEEKVRRDRALKSLGKAAKRSGAPLTTLGDLLAHKRQALR